jgi:drug/metabolite transporter (DMT)-like permease
MAETPQQDASVVSPAALPVAAPLPQDDTLKGILCLVAGLFVFSIQDLVIKLISADYPLSLVLTIRSTTALPILLAMVVFDGGFRLLRNERLPLVLVRAFVMFFAYGCYYMGFATLPLATCVALFFTTPLFITMLSVVILGEKVGPRRWGSILIGFIGVLVIVRPDSAEFDWAYLLPVIAGFAYAFSQVLTRKLGGSVGASVMAFYGNVFFLINALVLAVLFGSGSHANESHPSLGFLLRAWTWPETRDLLLMMACGLVAAVGLTLLTQAYRIGRTSSVAPFEYSYLLWGFLYGWLFWGEMPGASTWLGFGIIVGAGLYVLYRERQTGTPTLMRRGGWRKFRRKREPAPAIET